MSRLLLIWAGAALSSASESHGLEGINLMRRETPLASVGPFTGGASAESAPAESESTLDPVDKELKALEQNAKMQKDWEKAAEDEWHNAAKTVGEEDDRAEKADDDEKDDDKDDDDDDDSAAPPRRGQDEQETPTAAGEYMVFGNSKEIDASAPHAQVAAPAVGSLEQNAGAKSQATQYVKNLGYNRAPEHRRRGWSDTHKFEDAHKETTHLFDCTQVEHWKYAWSKLKLEWCCSNLNLGCPEHVEAMKHENVTEELHKHNNHGDELKFDCTSDYSRWPTSWSVLKQEWCCMYHKPPMGCKHKLSSGKWDHSFLAGTTVCRTEEEEVCKLVGCCHWTQDSGCRSSVGSAPCKLPDTWHNSYDDSYYYNQHTYPQYPSPPNYAGAPEPGSPTAYGTYPHTPDAIAANTPNYNPWFQEVQEHHQFHHSDQTGGQMNSYGGADGEQPFYGQYQHNAATIPESGEATNGD